MGYETRVFGEITIDPPLPFSKIRTSPFRSSSREDTVLMFDEDTSVEVTDEGTLSRVKVVGIKVRVDGEDKHYGMDIELRKIVEDFPEHQFDGALVIDGHDPGDISRLRIDPVSHRVIKEKAELRWPDGTKVEF
jgi:hypothetical protein